MDLRQGKGDFIADTWEKNLRQHPVPNTFLQTGQSTEDLIYKALPFWRLSEELVSAVTQEFRNRGSCLGKMHKDYGAYVNRLLKPSRKDSVEELHSRTAETMGNKNYIHRPRQDAFPKKP